MANSNLCLVQKSAGREPGINHENITVDDLIDDYVESMIAEGFYRFKPQFGACYISNGEQRWSYSEFVKTRQFIVGNKRDGSPKYLDLNTIDMNRKDFPIITKTIYDLNQPYGKIKDEPIFNTLKLLNPKFPIKGKNNDQDVSIFWNHLEYLCGEVSPEIKEWVKDWVADIFQNPNDKKGTALVFIGGQGCGKSIFFDNLMTALMGEYFHYDNGKDYNERFNSGLRDKLLINSDEGFATKSKQAEAKLKSFITQSLLKIEGKGKDSTNIFNPARCVFTTNSRYAINTADDDRRFAIFRTIKENFITPEYFDNFVQAIENKDMLEKFMYELKTRKITSRLNKAPETEAKTSQKVFSADKISEWFDFIISTPCDYKAPLKDNYQSQFNASGYLWDRYEENEKRMFKENGLETYLKFKGNNDGIDTTNKLFSALKSYLENNTEWTVSNEAQRLDGMHGFVFGEHKIQRMWIFRKK